ncbi:MAG: endonuclease/exonuclease/phosphatase family protein [Alphaproteobacteria bacterium]
MRGRTVRLMTWNIHGGARGGVRRSGARDADGIVACIDRIGPDILAVQEIDTRAAGADGRRIVPLLADAVGEHRAEAYTLVEADGEYGQAVFSRLSLSANATHDISWRRREPRRAIDVTVDMHGHRLRLIATHLGLGLRERRFQARRLETALGPSMQIPTVVVGDFNDWFPLAFVDWRLRPLLPVVTRIATFPARLPLLALDRIYGSADLRVAAARAVRETRLTSDHLGLVADIVLPDAVRADAVPADVRRCAPAVSAASSPGSVPAT